MSPSRGSLSGTVSGVVVSGSLSGAVPGVDVSGVSSGCVVEVDGSEGTVTSSAFNASEAAAVVGTRVPSVVVFSGDESEQAIATSIKAANSIPLAVMKRDMFFLSNNRMGGSELSRCPRSILPLLSTLFVRRAYW